MGLPWPCSPPHTTHTIQPLDDVPFACLGNAWDSKLQELNQQMGGQKIPKTTICHEFPAVFYKAVSGEAVKKGFLNCGLWPYDPQQTKIKRAIKQAENIHRACKWGIVFLLLFFPFQFCLNTKFEFHTSKPVMPIANCSKKLD